MIAKTTTKKKVFVVRPLRCVAASEHGWLPVTDGSLSSRRTMI